MKMLLLAVTVLGSSAALAADKFDLKGDVAKGLEVYKMYCSSCHGDDGTGAGPAGAALNPKPADFTDAARAAKVTDEQAYKIVAEGGAAFNKSPLMVSWKTSLNDQQMRDVTAYVRSLVKKAAPPAKDAKGTTPPKKK